MREGGNGSEGGGAIAWMGGRRPLRMAVTVARHADHVLFAVGRAGIQSDMVLGQTCVNSLLSALKSGQWTQWFH